MKELNTTTTHLFELLALQGRELHLARHGLLFQAALLRHIFQPLLLQQHTHTQYTHSTHSTEQHKENTTSKYCDSPITLQQCSAVQRRGTTQLSTLCFELALTRLLFACTLLFA